jgi:hypothetical protein
MALRALRIDAPPKMRAPTTQRVVYPARERARGPWDASINDVGFACLSGEFAPIAG